MDQLVALVSQKTGLSPEMSRTAVDTVLKYVKGRLPEPVASQLDGLIAGDGEAGGVDLSKALGGMFAK